MEHLNVEIKARSQSHEKIREILKSQGADFKGVDHQTDTYFKVNSGRLKLREGNIENHLIFYHRANSADPKESEVTLFDTEPGLPLKEILSKSLGALAVVDKTREIYFIDNVKFHLDNVAELGTFLEIEAIDKDGSIGKEKLRAQCQNYMDLFEIQKANLISNSYSDMIMEN